ncbi:cell surface protein [Methanosarcina siciliae C2J]|uniref:Cell surface protein n=1 Tax=Methanosarcina siciliae C2J TaxID=1434118 RepID=A0A0E3PNN2_9EURY|nr:cell surface protein [Methanosarcina siciliae C2J]
MGADCAHGSGIHFPTHTGGKVTNRKLIFILLTLILCGGVGLTLFTGAAAADEWVGGLPLTTIQTGTVTGDLWFDATPAPDWGEQVVTKTFTLPEAAVAEPGRIAWARLYISAYCGHMQSDYAFSITNSWDGDNDGVYEQVWPETEHGAFQYIIDPNTGETLGNDNSKFTGHGTQEPYLMLNDHENRVTSDYFMWYDVKDLISDQTINVNVNTTGSYDGRIKVITLVVAYNDPSSTTQTTYWVNEGHDICSYYTEDNFGEPAVGSTSFGTTDLSEVTSATLTVDYMASNNGCYGFPTADNNFEYTGGTPPVEGTFTNLQLDRDPDAQGAYSGIDSWDVTSSVTGGSDTTLGYARYFSGTGTAAFYKIPLAFLVVKSPGETSSQPPVANFSADITSGDAPLEVQFTDESTGTVSSYAWDFNNDGTIDSEDENPSYTYETAGTYSVNLTVTNEDGNDSELKTDYITVTQAGQVATNDLSISGIVNTVPASAVFARETNTVKVLNVQNTGTATLTNISIAVYASDVSSGTVPVDTTTIASLAGNAKTTVTLIDPTIRDLEGGTVTYTAVVDPDNLIAETDETNNNKSGTAKNVRYNGYKGKGIYWEGGSNITTRHTFDLQGDLLYSTQPDSAYKSVGSWGSGRTETWTASDLPVPSGSTIEEVFLYFAYNWDQTAGGYPWLNLSFNGNIIENGNLSTGNGNLYRDWSNFGAYADYEYGLCVYNVTDRFSSAGNSLVTNPYDGDNNLYGKVALYPSTLVVVYRNANETRKQIFINEECDELGLSASSYGTTPEEATAYAPFTGMAIETGKVQNAMLYSFAGSAGPDEGKLLFNGNIVASNAWQGSSSTASPLVFNATNYISETGNEAGVQATTSGGMDALQQILVVEYEESAPAAPVADFTAAPTSGDAPLEVNFTDTSTGSPTSWFWDFGDGANASEQNVSHTYTSAGRYNVTLTVSNAGGSDEELKTDYITVTEPSVSEPDLFVSVLTLNAGESFANEENTVSAQVENSGTAAAGSFTVRFDVNDISTNVTVDGLSAGANTTLSILDPSVRAYGDSVEITATADTENSIIESNETNNALSITKTVVYNGYKGKRWTDGDDINTRATFEGKYDVIYSSGDSDYTSSKWLSVTDTWTSSDLSIPADASVVSARLYQPYSYNKMGVDPSFTAVFNGATISTDAAYKDIKGFGSYNFPYGLYVYNVTDQFSTAGNTLVLTPEGTAGTTNDYALWGAYLIVVYSDQETTEKQIFINDEFDMLYSKSSYSVTSDEATAYANFSGVDTEDIGSAEVVSILASAGDSGKSKFFFNGEEYPGFWADYHDDSKIGFSVYNVTDGLASGANEARFQSYDAGTGGDNMYAMNAILVVEYSESAPMADFMANTTSGTAPLSVQFTDLSENATEWSWDFGDGANSTEQNPVHTYSAAGNYTVNLTVTNTAGSDSEVKTDYITVSESSTPAEPVAAFTADVTGGTVPLNVNFTDQSAGSPTSWNWDFGDGANSTEQNPSHTYTSAGNYTVNLTVENAAGTDFELKTDYIEVSEASGSTVTLYFDPENSSVSENESTEINLVASNFPAGLSGYNLTVALDDPTVAEIVDIEYPSWALITENSSLPATSIYLKAVDGEDAVKEGAAGVVLATLKVSGKEKGSTNISIGVDRLDDDSGNVIEPTFFTGKIEVTLLSPLPDQEYAPKDLDGDGLYEDLTGNGEFSFVDVVAYFHNMDWIEENMPVEYFDFNGNGRIDFDDIVDMFAMI